MPNQEWSQTQKLRVGLFGIGLATYWDQFPSLKERLDAYTGRIAQRLARPDVEVVNLGIVDSVDAAFDAAASFRRAGIDLLFLHAATYALSATVLPIVRRLHIPVIVLNLAPDRSIDYAAFNRLPDRRAMTGEWLAFCQECPVPELANVFRRSGVPFFQVTGTLENDPVAWTEVSDWLDAALVMRRMEMNRMGLLGHYYGGMLDIYSDLTQHSAQLGGHFEFLEVEQLAQLRAEVTPGDTEMRVRHFYEMLEIQPDCSEQDLHKAAVTSVALDRLVGTYKLGSLAYYYKGIGSPANQEAIDSIILGTSLLTARGIPVAGEYEVKNAQAMKIMDLFGAGGSFTEYYAADFDADVVLMGHDGPGHIAIAEGKTKVRPLVVYHGKSGDGLSVEMQVKHGPVTLLSLAEDSGGRLRFIVAEGESVPGPTLKIGNTNSRYRFSIGARRFIEDWNAAGPAHHCAVGVGHLADKIHKLSSLLQMEVKRIC